MTRGSIGTVDEVGRPRRETRIADVEILANTEVELTADQNVGQVRKRGGSVITSPWTVRVAAYDDDKRIVFHLVNYDRDESVDKRLSGPELERPLAVDDVQIEFPIPASRKVTTIRLYAPDEDQPLELPFEQRKKGRVAFQIHKILVYAVVQVITPK